MAYYQNEQQINAIAIGFRNKTLATSEWTHAAHLTVGLYYLKNFGFYQALCLLRSGIIEYNAATGGENNHEGGYHESLTLFWVWILNEYINSQPKSSSLLSLCNQFLTSKYAHPLLFKDFFSEQLIFSTRARASWVEPDLKALNFPF